MPPDLWDGFRTVLVSSVQTFGVAALGFLYGRLRGPHAETLTDVTMTVFVPALALTAILDAEIDAASLGLAASAVAIIVAASFAGGWLGLRLLRAQGARGLLLAVAVVNSANIPFPLVSANFGPEGLSLAVLCYLTTNVLLFTLGIAWISGKTRPDRLIREPAFLATVAAVVMKLAGAGLPAGIDDMVRLAGAGAIPSMLVILGITLSGVRLIGLRSAFAAVGLRFGLGLAGGILAVSVLGLRGLLRDVILFYSVLPSAVINTVFAKRYGQDPGLVATAVLLTTLLAVVILPLLLLAIRAGVPARIWP
jgi:hypothetical protein